MKSRISLLGVVGVLMAAACDERAGAQASSRYVPLLRARGRR
ncbi:MAG TPA: hypothetical protein VNZ53_53425 [Steroidobacteraceae bacterium]|jgi:hypothetical protein|nr:hypothetical protein [Steroidobacteraceae bacterium]